MSNNVINVSDFDFEEVVLKSNVPVLVDFYAVWCGPCKMQAPILNELADELVGKIKVCKINVDESEKIAIRYGIMSIPTLLVFNKGEVVEKKVGLTNKAELSAMIIKHL